MIDPVLAYSTFLGGSGLDRGFAIAVDGAGSAYVTGCTASTDFPLANEFPGTYGGGLVDAFVTKLDRSGAALEYSTYLGGSLIDVGDDIAVDAQGNAYVAGHTLSQNFPTTPGALATSFTGPSGLPDAFVSKLTQGGALDYSTYLGGKGARSHVAPSPSTRSGRHMSSARPDRRFPLRHRVSAHSSIPAPASSARRMHT